MVIQSLDLRHFRNYTHLQTEFSPETNWIFGKNGQGKTNLVEAIYYICNLESFRTRKNHHLLQSGHPQALIQAELKRSEVLHQIRIHITSRGRQVRLDHSAYNKVSEYILSFLALTFTPEEVVLFRGSPQERRRFFNRMQAILEPSYFRILQDYAKALSQKNAVLKQQQREKLPLWNQMLARHASIMSEKRRSFIESLNLHLAELFQAISGRTECLQLEFQPSNVFRRNCRCDENLIFDDLFSELDPSMKSHIMDFFSQLKNQIFITSTVPPEYVKPGNTLQISQGTAV